MKTSPEDCDLLLVGGGSIIAPARLRGVANIMSVYPIVISDVLYSHSSDCRNFMKWPTLLELPLPMFLGALIP